jgi:hypothetical protein
MPKDRKITITVSETVFRLLRVLAPDTPAPGSFPGTPENPDLTDEALVAEVVGELIDHAQQGVYRPGAWERPWLSQAFGDEWLARLEPGDPYGRSGSGSMFNRPRKAGK